MGHYACADLHGRLDLFKQIQKKLNNDDQCFVLGDCIDRGPDGIEVIKEVMQDRRFTPILGNHEQMMIYTCLEYEDDIYSGLQLWYENGGEPTFEKYLGIPTKNARLQFLHLVSRWPKRIDYKNTRGQNIALTHAGFNPCFPHDYLWDRDNAADAIWTGTDSEYAVHGHTYNKGIVRYCNGHKFNLDAASYCTDMVVLLNLDTFEWEYLSI